MSDGKLRLNREQLAAVEATEHAIAILAGPGSGKTRVLSYRARHLLRSYRKSRALLLTFTNKAAAEMKDRARGVSAVSGRRLKACNFHVFGMEVLREHGELVGISRDFEIMDDQEAQDLQNRVGGVKYANHGRPWSVARLRCRAPCRQVAKFGELYEAAKRSEGVVDFDDLVVYTARLFEGHEILARSYAAHYPHILIDEFQDTNAIQFAIVSCLAGHAKTVGIFADDDQAIYGFAGADMKHIHCFIEALGARVYPLTVNYRCRAEIVAKANRLLEADPTASERRMNAAYGGGEVAASGFQNVHEEARWICDDVERHIDESKEPPESVAILARTRRRATELVGQLSASGLPFSDWLGDRYDPDQRRVLRTCLAVLRPRLTPRQRSRLGNLFRFEPCAESNTAEFLRIHGECPGVAELQSALSRAQEASVTELLCLVRSSVGTVDPELADSLGPVVESFEAFEACDSEFTLEHLLNELALAGSGGAPTEGGGVKVASLHRTKGLQWPCVYLVGLEGGQLPFFKATSEIAIAEERRVCFVGVCRAERRLVMTHVSMHNGYPKQPSMFLREMGL